MKRVLIGLWFVLLSSVAWAASSEQQVQDAVKAGQYTQAQSMMADVVAEHPDSAKAHYVYAELLAHNGAYNKASDEAAKAQQLDPKIAFTDPAKFNAFEQELQRAQNRSTTTRPVTSNTTQAAPSYGSTAPGAGGGIPGWVWLVGLVFLAIVLWRGLMRSRVASGAAGVGAPAAGYGQPGMNQGYGPGYSPYGPGGMPGVQPRSGALGTGLAVAGGVAGGMLLDEALHHRDGGSGGGGGLISDANAGAGSDLQDRSIDFGSGNDWGSGGGGGGIDLGGGGDSGGGGGDWT